MWHAYIRVTDRDDGNLGIFTFEFSVCVFLVFRSMPAYIICGSFGPSFVTRRRFPNVSNGNSARE